MTLLLVCSSSWAGTFTIRVKKDVASTMDLSNGLYLWWWETNQDGQLATMTLESDGWYTTTINSAASTINCLAVNQDVAVYGWTGCQQTADFTDITGDICLLIHADWDSQGHYLLTETPYTASGSVAYELNGGVTNDYGWLSKGDMWTAFCADAGVTTLGTLEEVQAETDPFAKICTPLGADQAQAILDNAKWDWLEAYIMQVQNADLTTPATQLDAGTTSVGWRFALAAFFLESQRVNWPKSADFAVAGTVEAFQPAWKHGFDNPTEPTAEWVLNAPYKEGMTFDGWYATADFSGEKVTKVDATTTGTLYAKWIEYIPTIAEVKAMAEGTETKVAGVVNWVRNNNVFIQDATGGFLLYGSGLNPEVGQKIVAKGLRSSHAGSPELTNAVIESAEPGTLYDPIVTNLYTLCTDETALKYFGQRVKVLGVLFIEKYDEFGSAYLTDGAGLSVKCHYMTPDQTTYPVGKKVTLTAVASQYNGIFQFEGDVAGFEAVVVGKKDTYVYPERYDGRYQLTNTWVISNIEDNFAANKPGSTDYVRGMAVKDGKMYFINRENASITVVDGATGEMLDPIIIKGEHLFEVEKEDGSWGASCTLPYNDIKFDQAGNCLIGSCMGGLNQTFIIYLVDLETGEATEVVREKLGANPDFEVSFASGRFDAFGVAGNVKENGVIMAAENQGSWNVYRWLIEGGVAAPAEEISMLLDPATDKSLYLEVAGFGTAAQIFPQDETGSVFYVDGFNTLPMLFDENGMLLDDFINCPYGTKVGNAEGDTCQMNTGHNGLCEFQVGNEYFLVLTATNTAGNPTSSFALYKFADESRAFDGLEPLWFFPKNGMGSTTNGCRTAPVSVEVKDDVAYIYVYTNNNGYARYELKVDENVEPTVYEYNIRIQKDEVSDMDLSNGLYLYWWQTIQNGQLVPMTLNSDGWYTTTIATTATAINCLAVNVDVNAEGWVGQQTVDYTHIKGDVCLMIGAKDYYYNGHYNLYAVPCEDMEYAREHDFEDAEKNAQWRFVQSGQTNYWTIGSAAGSANEGSNALYITNNGSEYGYTNNERSVSWAYLPVTLSALDSITFDWKGTAEGSYDNLKVYLFPKGYTPVAGSEQLPDQAILLGDYISGVDDWQHIGFFPGVEGEYNLCLRWRNDGSVGEMPIAVDNLSIFTAAGTIDYPLVYVLNDDGTAIVAKCDAAYAGELTIPAYVYSEGRAYSVVAIGEKAFDQCNITSVTIPNSVTRIGANAFMYCYSLTAVTLSENLAAIENYTFYGCENLAAINVPNSVQSIGEEAFAYCYDLASMTIGSGVTSIAYKAFGSCSSLTSLTIPNSVTYIASYAFWGTRALTSIVVESGNTVYDSRNNCNAIVETATNTLITGCQSTIIPESITSLGQGAFSQCDNLISITIPNGVTSIGADAFYYCDNLASVNLGEGVQTIGYYAFARCNALTTITIPNSVTTIREGAFFECDNLASVNLGEGVHTIGYCAFEYCHALTSITIPASVTSIDNYAFYNCPTIVMEGATPPAIAYSTFNSDATILVPCTAVETYQAAEYWQNLNIQGNNYTVALSSTEGGSALVTSSDCATNMVTIEAYADSGYEFTQWSDGNTDNPRTLTLTENIELTAEFSKVTYPVTNLVVTPNCGTAYASWESDAPWFEVIVYNSIGESVVSGIINSKDGVHNTEPLADGEYIWQVTPLHSNASGDSAGEAVQVTFIISEDNCLDLEIYDLVCTITNETEVNITWNTQAPECRILIFDYQRNPIVDRYVTTNNFSCTLTEIGRYSVEVQGLSADRAQYSSWQYASIDITYGNWTPDWNFVYGEQGDNGTWNDAYQRPILLYSEDRQTEMRIYPMPKHENSIIGTYIVENNTSNLYAGGMWGDGSYIRYKGMEVSGTMQSGVVTIMRNTDGQFVISFDLTNYNGTNYTNTCTIANMTGNNIGDSDVTALTATEATTWTQNLAHTDLTTMPYFVEGVISQISSTSSDMAIYGGAHLYISEDGSANNEFYCYGTRWLNNTAFTTGNEIAVGDTIIVYGNLQNYLGSTPEIKGYIYEHKEKVQPEGEDPVLDINFTHGKVIRYSDSNKELHLYSADENTQIVFDLYSEYANSILGTYILGNSSDPGDCWTKYSFISFAGDVTLSSGVVTVIKDAIGNFVISFDVVDQNGNAYANTCTIASSLITLEGNADISGTGVTALTAVEANDITQNLSHTDETVVPYLVKGVISQITSYDVTQYARARFYISEDGSTSNEFYCFNAKWLNNTSFTTGNEIAVGDTVVIYGNLQNYNGTTPEIKGYVYQSIKHAKFYYTLSVTADEGGTVDINPLLETYPEGTTVSLSAIANTGYEFVSWNDDITDRVRTIVMTSDVTLHAIFRSVDDPVNYYTLTVTAGEGGIVTKSPDQESYADGTVVTITAIANAGYEFVSWSDGNTAAERSIVMLGNVTFHATFRLVEVPVNYYTLTVTAGEGGIVTKSPDQESYADGTVVTIAAIANTGYEFVSWSDGNTDNPRTIIMEQDVDLTAVFQPIYHQFTIEERVGGKVSAHPDYDQYIEGQEVIITATPDEGYEFVCWWDGNMNNPRTLIMNQDYTVSATFRSTDIPENNYTLILTHSTGGSVTQEPNKDYYASGDQVLIEAIANDGYVFQGWSDGSVDPLRRITITQDTIIHASFVEETPAIQYTLTLTSSEGGMVTKTPDQVAYNEGTLVRITAIPEDGFEFQKWGDGNTDAERYIRMDKDYALKAYFKRMASDMDVTNLSVSSSSLAITARWESAAIRFDVTVTNSKDEVVKNEIVDDDKAKKTYRYRAPKNGTYTITIKPIDFEGNQIGIEASKSVTVTRTYSLYISAATGGTVNEEVNEQTYNPGESVIIIATPNEGYQFYQWDDGDTNATRTLIMDQDYTLEAQFKRIPTYTLTIFQGEHGVASMEAGTYTYQEKEQVTLTAIPDEGYMFDHWMVNGVEDTIAELTLTMTQDYTVYPVCVSKPVPTYTLTILPTEFGKANIEIGKYTYNEGEEVTLLPLADENYLFDLWMVNGEAKSDSVLVLVMDKDYEVMPTFKPNTVGVENLYDGVQVRVQENMIIVEASHEQDIVLYDLVGHLVGSVQNSREAYFTVRSAGLYLLRTNNGIQKIRVE